ncbi:hypothetical protein P8452_70400 [Trifolium repens]|nr:hypothetical protein P8452_70400 [Trifolium repens]
MLHARVCPSQFHDLCPIESIVPNRCGFCNCNTKLISTSLLRSYLRQLSSLRMHHSHKHRGFVQKLHARVCP